jgi:tetratricopeptide (TPR) repeat protein
MIIETILLGAGAIVAGQIGTEFAKNLVPELTSGAVECGLDALLERIRPDRNQDFMRAVAVAMRKASKDLLTLEVNGLEVFWTDSDRAIWKDLGRDAEKLFVQEFSKPQKAVRNALLIGTVDAVSEALEGVVDSYFQRCKARTPQELKLLFPPAFLHAFEQVLKHKDHEKGWKAFQRDLAWSLHQQIIELGKGQAEILTVLKAMYIELGKGQAEILTVLKAMYEDRVELPDIASEFNKQAEKMLAAILDAISEEGKKTRSRLDEHHKELVALLMQYHKQDEIEAVKESLITLSTELASVRQDYAQAIQGKDDTIRRLDEDRRKLEADKAREQALHDRIQSATEYEKQRLSQELERVQASVAFYEEQIRNGEGRIQFLETKAEEDSKRVAELEQQLQEQRRLALSLDIDDLLRQALEKEAQGDVEGARAVFNPSVEMVEEKRRELYEARADTSLRNFLIVEAWEDYQVVLEGASEQVQLRVSHHLFRIARILIPSRHRLARAVAERNHEILRNLLGDEHLDTAKALANLAELHRVEGQISQALEMNHQALQVILDQKGECPSAFACSNNIGLCLMELGAYQQAVTYLGLALNGFLKSKDEAHIIQLLINTADCFREGGKLDWALLQGNAALTKTGYFRGEEDIYTCLALRSMAEALREAHLSAEAEDLNRKALAIVSKLAGVSNSVALGIMNNLGLCLADLGRYAEAEKFVTEALHGREELLGADDMSTLTSYNNVAALYRKSGRLEESEKYARLAFSGFKEKLGLQNRHTFLSANTLAESLMALGRHAEAKEMFKYVINACKSVLGERHHHTLAIQRHYAGALLECGDFAEAETAINESYRLHQELYGDKHIATVSSLSLQADLLCNQGKFEEAKPLLRQVVDARTKIQGVKHPGVLSAQAHLAGCLMFLEEYDEAQRLFMAALEGRKEVFGEEHPTYATTAQNLGVCLQRAGRKEEAYSYFKQAFDLKTKIFGSNHPASLRAGSNYAMILEDEEKYEEAEALLRKSLQGFEATFGKAHPETLQERHSLGVFLSHRERYTEALALLEEGLALAREHLPTEHHVRLLYESDLPRIQEKAAGHQD